MRVVASLAILLAILLAVFVIRYTGTEKPAADTILVHVYVLKDNPDLHYVLREGNPESVGVYEFYYKKPNLPGSGAFRKIDSIRLNKLNETTFYGEKRIKKIDGILCIGYPSTNFIDGKACVKIDQSKREVSVTVHYWKTSLMRI